MRPADPIIATVTEPSCLTVTARYETPAARRAVRTLERLTALGLTAVTAIIAVNIVGQTPATVSAGERLAVMFAITGLAFATSTLTAAHVVDHRFGLRRILDRRLEVSFAREAVTHADRRFERTAKIAFTSEPHRLGRDEERTERVTGVLVDETYRLAHEVKLQHGETFIVLAEVSSAEAANAIVRRLQAADDVAIRGTGAFTQDSAFGPRQKPE